MMMLIVVMLVSAMRREYVEGTVRLVLWRGVAIGWCLLVSGVGSRCVMAW